MTPEERRELVRAQREVMWNLQKGDIVTVVNPGDDPVPYKRQGNPDVNTPLSVKKRQALRKKPLIQVLLCCAVTKGSFMPDCSRGRPQGKAEVE